ncbi:hypothetical protein [Streptomyces sp. HM190]|uniref:hypothetical protein n=1 Tax=Streptomyces sp. HM190 TaxID=2695266 RepID=UPI00135CF143|nr:hypothetical protein [Streptomyces sp. HM190]
MTYLQITLALVEIFSAGAAVWQLKGARDPLWIPVMLVIVGAGVLVPSIYPIGHATIVSLGLQIIAAAILLWVARIGLRRDLDR